MRLDWPGWGAHVDDVLAEARRPGIASLAGKSSIKQREAETVKWLEHERDVLVQDDCAGASPSPPRELLELYGVRAQMLAPLVLDEGVVGWISVHETTSTRRWTEREISAVREAAAEIEGTLQ